MIPLLQMTKIDASKILSRKNNVPDVSEAVAKILLSVKVGGDKAVLRYTEEFDKVSLQNMRVTPREIDDALKNVEPEFIAILKRAADNIRDFHKHQIRSGFIVNEKLGVVMGQKVIPMEKVGIYVPGGTAAYPSTVLMDAIPAKLAGVKELVMVTPPGKDGTINPSILAAATVAGIDTIFKVGGAQAIAALANGTESIPKVDKIVGPGNAYVAEAKKQVYGQVSIDMIAGPSEILIVSDGKSNADVIAADLLSQAEHDRVASAILLTDSMELALNVQLSIERQLDKLERYEIARASIDHCGKIIVTEKLEDAIEISNMLAPEHLELCLDEPFAWLDRIKNAGSVFMGRNCPEALGDYMAGPNHTLPTNGTARFSSPLSVDDFVKKTQFTYFTEDALKAINKDVAYFARKEGLTAHARSAMIRTEGMR